jgi:hypothetical protein
MMSHQKEKPRGISDNGLLSLFLVQKGPLLVANLAAMAFSIRYPHDLFSFTSEKKGIDVDFFLFPTSVRPLE